MKMPVRIVLFSALCTLLFACQARIQHGLDEQEANEIQTVLLEAGFDARKVPEGGKKPTWAIEVDDEQSAAATRVLAELGLPRPKLEGFDGLEVGLVPTPSQERAVQVNALSEELARTLQSVTGVTLARVHLVVPQPARPGQAPQPAKASAFLRVRPGFGPRVRGMEEDLRRLVAGSVEGLAPEDVTLVVNEVVSTVAAPEPGISPVQRMRWLVAGMGALVSILAVLLVFLAVRLRGLRTRPVVTAPAAPAAPPKPVINAANKRAAA
ncbi:MAG: flagellar M-ring protein FliF [Myxococcaceae bacterium]|nr:flagellar M-ring protein FliF [Myxococcaceae bacterium]